MIISLIYDILFIEKRKGDLYWNEMVATVEHWVRDNPERTRQTELLKMFPDCKMDSGVPAICPKTVDKNYKGDCNICEGSFCCADCRDAYWSVRV